MGGCVVGVGSTTMANTISTAGPWAAGQLSGGRWRGNLAPPSRSPQVCEMRSCSVAGGGESEVRISSPPPPLACVCSVGFACVRGGGGEEIWLLPYTAQRRPKLVHPVLALTLWRRREKVGETRLRMQSSTGHAGGAGRGRSRVSFSRASTGLIN